jgi:hypothetical protein
MSKSNCLFFAASLAWWRHKRWKSGKSTQLPRLEIRPSKLGGPFHILVGTLRADGMVSVVSYKPLHDDKQTWIEAIWFEGKVVRGD